MNAITLCLNWVERKGNKLPHPVTIFVLFALLIIVISAVTTHLGVSVDIAQIDRITNEAIVKHELTRSLLSQEGLIFIFEKAIHNFTSFAPLGVVLVSMLGISTAEGSGLLNTLIKKMLAQTPTKMVSAIVVFTGVMSNVASDAGYVIVIPLGAMIFLSLNRHPLAGLAAAFFGVSAGFSANLLLGSIDPLLGGFSTQGAKLISADYNVAATANYYFMFVSTFLITITGALVTEKIVEPRLGKYEGTATSQVEGVNEHEQQGLKYALYALLATILVFCLLTIPEGALLRNAATGSILENSPFINSIVIIIALLFFIPGIAFGIGVRRINSDKDVVQIMTDTMNKMGGYIVLTFVASQFVAYFNYSNLGIVSAVAGADLLKSTGFTGIPLLIIFILFTSVLNLFIGSSVTKWSIMASIFVPMFLMLGISPEMTQLAYRIGDSSTNIVSPLMPFFAIVITIANDYRKNIGIGTLVSMMMPYSIVVLLSWILLMILWLSVGLPIGPSVSTFLN